MQGAEQKRRLLTDHNHDAMQPLVALGKCAAGILALVLVAAGPWLTLSPEAVTTAPQQPAVQAIKASPDSGVAESKRVFDERRQRYQARREGALPGMAQGTPAALSNLDQPGGAVTHE